VRGHLLTRSALVAASIATIAVGASPASAAPVARGNASDTLGAYYDAAPTHGLVSAGTTFKVPTISCASGQGQSFGVVGVSTRLPYILEQADVDTTCNGTTAVYQVNVVAGTFQSVQSGVSPGDTVVASFYQTSSWSQATVHDLTTGSTWTSTSSQGFLSDNAFIGVNDYPANGIGNGVAAFGTVLFSRNQVNGDYLGFQQPTAYNWKYQSTPSVTIGRLISEVRFKLVFKHS
jgi:hypothetical protein